MEINLTKEQKERLTDIVALHCDRLEDGIKSSLNAPPNLKPCLDKLRNQMNVLDSDKEIFEILLNS